MVQGSLKRSRFSAVAMIAAGTLMVTAGCGSASSPQSSATGPARTAADKPPTFISGSAAVGKVSQYISISVSAAGDPLPTITESGKLPTGLRFTASTSGALLSGTPAATSGGAYKVVFTARNAVGSTVHEFTLSIDQPPKFTSGTDIHVSYLKYDNSPITASGYPAPTITESGPLPGGMVFKSLGGGSAAVQGNPSLTSDDCNTEFKVTAKNSSGTVSENIYIFLYTAMNAFCVFGDLGGIDGGDGGDDGGSSGGGGSSSGGDGGSNGGD
jgi:Putative Ig domain